MEKTQDTRLKMLITIFGGWFGLHKFMNREIGMGCLYLFTVGLFCIGWIMDSVRATKEYLGDKKLSQQSLMPQQALEMIENGNVARLEADSSQDIPFNLAKGEVLYYFELGSTSKSKTRTTGYKRSGQGYSMRITRGVSWHVGDGESKAIRETTTATYGGMICLTNKRVIYTSLGDPFEIPLSKITSISLMNENEIIIQSGAKIHRVTMPKAHSFAKAFAIVSSQTRK